MNDIEFRNKVVGLASLVFPLANRILRNQEDAKDAVQEIMIKLWEKRKKLNNHPNIRGLVLLSTRNHCLDILRSTNYKKKHEIETEFIPDVILEEEDNEYIKECYKNIQQKLEELPENQKMILILRDFDGFEFEEIAEVTGLNIEHIRVLLSRARKQIRKQIVESKKVKHETI